jgi:hypothetical protein
LVHYNWVSYFCYGFHGFITISYPCCELRRVIIVGPSQSSVLPSQYFLKKNLSFNVSPFKYLKNISANMNQIFDFLASLHFFRLKKNKIDLWYSTGQKNILFSIRSQLLLLFSIISLKGYNYSRTSFPILTLVVKV